MKNFQVRRLSCFVKASRLAALLLSSSMIVTAPAMAQESGTAPSGGQIDLLATVQDNASMGATSGISSIDEAVATVSDSVEVEKAAPAQLAGDAVASGPEDNATAPTAAPAASLSVSSSTAVVNLDAGNAPAFRAGDIGIEAEIGVDDGLTATMWRGTASDMAILLLDTDAIIGSSPSLSKLASRVVSRRAVRPEGTPALDRTLLASRLDWLSSAGRSDELAVMIDQLPNDAPWLEWKQWLVTTQLMMRRDDDACRNVMYQVGRTFEPFWHKAKVICTAAQGDVAGARFAADILFATGVDDPVFAGLVSKLLGDGEPGPIDPALIEPLHIVLMDAAHHDIDVDGLAALPGGSIQTAVELRYLDPEARLVSTWRALSHGLIDHDKAAKLWRSAKIEPDAARLALARHQSQPSALTRALVWRALDAEKTADRLPLLAAAMDADIADGAGLMMAPLYAPLISEALTRNGAEPLLAAENGVLRTKLAMICAAGGFDEVPAALASDEARAAQALLTMAETGLVDLESLRPLDMWHLLPLATGAVETAAEPAWLVTALDAAIAPEQTLSISPVLLRALDEAAAAGRVAETILLAHRIVGVQDLAMLDPSDMVRVAGALDVAGQSDAVGELRREIVASRLLAHAVARAHSLPPQAEAVAPAITTEADAADNATAVDQQPVAAPAVDAGQLQQSDDENSL